MKRRDLVRRLDDAGFELYRHGSNHDIYRKGKNQIAVPRHSEIVEDTAKKILKEAGL